MSKITISVRTHIKLDDIESLLDSASRGSSYWCYNELAYESNVKLALKEQGVIIEDQEGSDKDGNPKTHVLNLTKIKKGLTVMAKKERKHFADFLNGDYDQTTGDVFLQCCLFGEVIYG